MNLKKTNCTILNEKFQFYVVDLKIVSFICDSNDREIDSIKRIYVLKELNEACFNKTYVENQLKRFRIRNVQVENAEEKKLDLTLIQKNAEKFKRKTETAEENSEKKFEMLKKKFDQIKELRKN